MFIVLFVKGRTGEKRRERENRTEENWMRPKKLVILLIILKVFLKEFVLNKMLIVLFVDGRTGEKRRDGSIKDSSLSYKLYYHFFISFSRSSSIIIPLIGILKDKQHYVLCESKYGITNSSKVPWSPY